MPKILVHVHLYYQEMWSELKNCLKIIKNNSTPEIYITMSYKNEELLADIKSFDDTIKVKICENRGFDVGPFIEVINSVNLDDYDYLVKLHTKRNIDCEPWYYEGYNVGGTKWREYLLNFCKTDENFKKSLKQLSEIKTGMVTDYRLIAKNADKFASVIQEVLEIEQPKSSFYVAGTMFIAKAHIFKKLQHKLSISDFGLSSHKEGNLKEKIIKKGDTRLLAHIIEHVIGNLVQVENLEIKSYDGKKQFVFHHLAYRLKRFFYYHKITPDKEILKICAIPVYRKKKHI